MASVDNTLANRGKHYEGPGGYADTAETSQAIKDIVRTSHNFRQGNLTHVMMESLDMIANKLSRILNGNATHADSWHDLAGYATLAEKVIQEALANSASTTTLPTFKYVPFAVPATVLTTEANCYAATALPSTTARWC